MDRTEIKEFVETLAAHCLNILVKSGFVSAEQINESRWYVKLDESGKLDKELFFAAASVDEQHRPFMLFNPCKSLQALAYAVPHEVIHLAQLCKGDWLPCYGYSIWKGVRIERVEADDPAYITGQPWEAEAHAMDEGLRAKMYETFPMLK